MFEALQTSKMINKLIDSISQGHRYIRPEVTSYKHVPLVPIGEWKLDYIITKRINKSNELLFSWSDFYEVKPTSATEF